MHTFHPRSTWVSAAEPVTGPALPWPTIDTNPCHYTAAVNLIDGDPNEFVTGIPAYLRRIHHDYLTNRPQFNAAGVKTSDGYSIGYNFAIDWLGGIWELRGFDYKCAANATYKGVVWNNRTVAILFLVDGNDGATDEALAAARWVVAETRRRAGRRTAIKPHSAIGATACCGDGLRAQIAAGKMEPDNYTTPPVDVPAVPPTQPTQPPVVETPRPTTPPPAQPAPTPGDTTMTMRRIEVYAIDPSDGVRKKCAAEFYGLEVQPGGIIPEMEWTGPVDEANPGAHPRETFTYVTYRNLGVQARVLNAEDLAGINLKYGSRGLPQGPNGERIDWFTWKLSLFRNRVDG